MDDRELGLAEIVDRITLKREALGLQSLRSTPTEPVSERDLPCVVVHEGDDYVVKHSTRSNHGYPATRTLEVTLEIIVKKDVDVKTLYRQLRSVVFSEKGVEPPVYNARLIPDNKTTFIRENHTEGPTGYGLPGLLGMRLVLDLIYIDGGL